MNDSTFINAIAHVWIGLGGDAVGVDYLWGRLKKRIEELQEEDKRSGKED